MGTTLRSVTGAIGWLVSLGIILPLASAYFLGFSVTKACGLVASAFFIEYGSIPVGIGLGLPWPYVLPAATSIEAGIFLGLFGLLDSIGSASGLVSRFLDWTRKVAKRSRLFDRYGIYGLFPIEILIGVYLCSPASWLFGWNKWRSFAITMGGYCVAAIGTTLATLGLIRYFFS